MNDKTRRYFYSLMTDETKGPAAAVPRLLLSALSLLYLCGLKAAIFLYRANLLITYRPKCKVISVGNITLGGTGKTPLVIAIARDLIEKKKKVVILARGYMKDTVLDIADEAIVIKKSLGDTPVMVGRDRIRSAKTAEEKFSPDVILLDDGFQHWRLKRDIDIVTIDGRNPFGNGRLIPRGILREPVSSLKRAGIIVVTKSRRLDDRMKIKGVNSKAEIFASSYEATDTAGIRGRKVAIACGIGDPSSFEETVRSLGAVISRKFIFMDHHRYSGADVGRMAFAALSAGLDTVVTTEKDMVKLEPLVKGAKVRFVAVGIEIKMEDKERFFGRLDSLLSGKV